MAASLGGGRDSTDLRWGLHPEIGCERAPLAGGCVIRPFAGYVRENPFEAERLLS